MNEPLLRVRDLKTYFFTQNGVVKAVDGVDLNIKRGECFGLVGESGCGKSTLGLTILRIIPRPGEILEGEIMYGDTDILSMSDDDVRNIRGGKIAIIFQDPTSSLNPVFTIGDQIVESIKLHRNLDGVKANEEVIEVLKSVGIPNPESSLNQYPDEYSGGMRQRVMIAMALSCQPDLLIADEPTTNLDVTIQAQILELMKKLKEEYNMSILLITHNLGIIAEMCDRVAVMYCGKIVEEADIYQIFQNPGHPYTKALLNSISRIDIEIEELEVIPGIVPSLIDPPSGCRFHPRCYYAKKICEEQNPKLIEIEKGHAISCLRYKELVKT